MTPEIRSYVHYAITAFALTGVFWISNCPLLKAYFLMLVVIFLHWLTNDDRCCLSQMDHGSDTKAYSRGIWAKFGLKLSDTQINYTNKFIIIALIIASYLKLKKVCVKIL